MLTLVASTFTPAVSLTSWASHGEIATEVAAKLPAVNHTMINAINSNPRSTWKAGVNNKFVGATLADAKVLMGVLQNTHPSTLPYRAQPVEGRVGSLPTDFDWRTDPRAANCPSVAEVRDQANCGSCWAFGSVEAMSDRYCIKSEGKKNVHLSAQEVTACDHEGDMGCNGGVPETVYTYWRLNGIVDGGNYNDTSMCQSYELAPCAHHTEGSKYPECKGSTRIGACQRSCTDNGADWQGSKHVGEGGYSVCTQGPSAAPCADAMAQEIYYNGPITGMFFVHQSFTAYKSGVYSSPGHGDPMLGGHAIKIMGFGVEDGVDYWLVANSWNEDWGLDGFFKIKRGTNECQIEDAVINGGPVAGTPTV